MVHRTHAILAVGATPRYDIDPNTNMLAADTLAAVDWTGVKAAIVTHLVPDGADARHRGARPGPGVSVIEDCAQAHGSRLEGRLSQEAGARLAASPSCILPRTWCWRWRRLSAPRMR